MEEHKIRILATKALAPGLLKKAAAAGIRVDCVPFIRTVAEPPESLQGPLSSLLSAGLTVAFTSANAVKAVVAALGGATPEWRIACIEGATLQEVRRRLPASVLLATAPDAHTLAERLAACTGIPEVHFFCGDIRLPVLRETLEAAGLPVRELIVYRTLPTPVQVAGAYGGILFFSPSAVRSYASLNPAPPAGTVFFAIGPTTAAALPHHSNPVIMPPVPDAGSMIDQVIRYFNPAQRRPSYDEQ